MDSVSISNSIGETDSARAVTPSDGRGRLFSKLLCTESNPATIAEFFSAVCSGVGILFFAGMKGSRSTRSTLVLIEKYQITIRYTEKGTATEWLVQARDKMKNI